jgi:hypothetical protein
MADHWALVAAAFAQTTARIEACGQCVKESTKNGKYINHHPCLPHATIAFGSGRVSGIFFAMFPEQTGKCIVSRPIFSRPHHHHRLV